MTVLILLIFIQYVFTVENRYILQLYAQPTISGNSTFLQVNSVQSELDDCLYSNNYTFTNDKVYSKVFAGRSITIDAESDTNLLAQCPQIKKLWPLRTLSLPVPIEGGPVRPLQFFTHNMTGVHHAQTILGLSGKGIKIGIIDTGVDYTHPAFGNCTKIGDDDCVFKYGYDFVGDTFDGSNKPQPSNNPFDSCIGHGTHVSGIVAGNDANGSVQGVAINAQLGMYRIFGCSGGTTSDLVISAMRKAVDDGMDIISMSLGGDAGFSDSPESIVVEELSKSGIIVVVAVGNAGPDGIWMASNPSIAKSATAVTSFDSSRIIRRTLHIGNSKEIVFAFPLSPSNPPNPKTYNVEVVTDLIQTSNGVRASEMCSAPVVNVKGKLVLLTRGSCSIYEKSQFLEKAGAIGFIVANNKPGDIGPLSPLSIIPIYTISEVDGIYLASILTQSNQIASFSSKDQTFDLPSGGSLSKFSTWGLGPELEIKPDFGAPGGYIYSSYPKAKGSYAVLSGTSMSTPYIAGCYALYLEYLQSQSTKSTKYQYNVIDIRDVFSLYSSAIDTRDQTQDSSISVARQGGGLIQIDRALLGTTYVTPAKLSIGLLPMSQPVVFTIYNNGNTTRQYQFVLITAPTIDITNSTNPRTLNSSSNIRFSEDGVSFSEKLSVTIKNQDSVQIYCMVDGDADVSIDQGGQYLLSGFIEIIPSSLQDDMYQSQTGDYVMSVPFAGLIADLTKQVIFETGTNGIKVKWMRGSDKTMVKGSNGSINVMDFIPGDNIVIQWRLLVPLQSVSVDVYGIDGNLLGNVMNTERQQRNSGKVDNLTNYFTTVRWDMTVTDATGELTVLANGSYTLGLTYTTVTMIGSNAGITQTLSLTNLIVSSSNQVDSV